MNSKRRRVNPDVVCTPKNHDCYDDVMKIINGNITIHNFDIIQSSWIYNSKWISSSEVIDSNNLVETFHSISVNIQNELQQLSKQLILVKQQLTVAGEKSAIACNSRSTYSTTAKREFEKARRACNPYETLGEGKNGGLNSLFMNRSAIKLANIDAMLGFCLTTPLNDTLRFADLCAAPGGFSEYIIWRSKSNDTSITDGYGMSLIGVNEQGKGINWKMKNLLKESRNASSRYRVCTGVDGTGDIYKWNNVTYFQDIIRKNLQSSTKEECGNVHLVVADGGFDAQRDCEDQEHIAQKLIVCEIAAALLLLKEGGNFVIKMFGFQTPIIKAVMDYLFFAFKDMIVIKPISSRPASAERYVCYSGFNGNPQGWDGEIWCAAMLMNENYLIQGKPSVQYNMYSLSKLHHYLDEFDHDLCNLNLKACVAILTYLETKSESLMATSKDMDEDEFDALKININSYRYAWRLLE